MNDAELNGLVTLFIKGCSSFADLVLERDQETKSLPIMTARDLEILRVLSQIKYQGSDYIDFLSLSYCSNKEHITEARQTLDALGLSNAKILAKIESRKALSNFESILNTADGMIISRGNLGIDVD